ncbi:MAG: N-acetylneuraminate synthase family protein [Deltaproteobacteria bacterium]
MRKLISVGGRSIGRGSPVFIIAEIGSNHDASLKRAKEMIDASVYAGADAVKFQSFTAGGLLNPLKKNGDGGWAPHPAYNIIEKLTLPEEWHKALFEYSAQKGIIFLSAPFDSGRAALLNSIGVPAFKIASGDLTNLPLLKQVASYGRPVILSTGASYLEEVKAAVNALKNEGTVELALMHCASLYPPSYEDVNLKAMVTLRDEFNCPVGFSDHTPGSSAAIAAVALGASIIEKHLTLNRTLKGPDHPYAMEVEEFKSMVKETRNIEKALGSGIKKPSDKEMDERVGARRSIYASMDIKKGERIEENMLKLVRHAIGLKPEEFPRVVGKRAQRDIQRDTIVQMEDICQQA